MLATFVDNQIFDLCSNKSEPMAPARRVVVLSDSESSDDEMADFIVEDEGEEGSSEDEGSRDESDESDASDESEEGVYVDWSGMREMYQARSDTMEPSGYSEHKELHSWGWSKDEPWSQAMKDALWSHITRKTNSKTFRDKWGVFSEEVTLTSGVVERIVRRREYGTEFEERYFDALTGRYRDAFFKSMEAVFEQAPYQGPPDNGELPEPSFLDFKQDYTALWREESRKGIQGRQHPHGPLWCLCCQCTDKQLVKIMIARHIPSGILVATGGDCSKKMLGLTEVDEGTANLAVGQLLGLIN